MNMGYDLWLLTFQFGFFYILYLLILNNKLAQNLVLKFENFKLLILGILILQLFAIFLIKYNVVDVFINSDAGKNLLEKVDIYWIDADHGKYPFFPFLIFLHAALVSIWQKFGYLSYNFYFKLVSLSFFYFFALQLYKSWKKENLKTVKLNLLAFLLSPITYAILLYHGQFDIILITFLYLAIKAFQKNSFISKMIISAPLFAISIATKTWSIIMLPIFAIPLIKNFSIKEFIKFFAFVLITVGLLLINIKFYTLQVFGSSTRTVLNAVIHPGGPTEIWGLGLLLKPFVENSLGFLSLLQLLAFAIFWLYIYYQIKISKFKYNNFFLVFMTILIFYIFTPRWGIQYIFWHFPFMFLLFGTKFLRNWIYQLVIPIYLFLNYCNITAQTEVIPLWIIWFLGLIIYFNFIKMVINLLRNPQVNKF
ncbi:MAG: hypothetical protein H6772_04260 [Pseudomonadales bacterium]|nr:hypothetical protein [Pseudomonadales bacterium]